ncbi:MAG: S46 family peptidase [Asticcacaulis sp.]
MYFPYYFTESALNASDLFYDARMLVRAAEERQKPSADRLPEYADSRLPSLKDELLADAPVYKPKDQLVLEQRLSKAREYLTADSPETALLLGKESPEGLAARLVGGTKLDDPKVRQALWDGGLDAIKVSDDPMIQYALKIDDEARKQRAEFENKVTGPTRVAEGKIARARFAVYGTGIYPDATFTLRLSYGKVAGWTYNSMTVAPFTNFKGLYARATGQAPFDLAPHLAAAEGKYDEDTVFDYVTTNDITGGNSGSPVVNAKGEVIGAAFDGNIHSIGGDFAYDGPVNRTVVVSTAAVTVALDKVYGDQPLLKELSGR